MLKGSLQQVGFVLRVIALMGPISSHALETGNLLLNGDAELHRCTKDWTAQTPVLGWRVLDGAASVLCYSAFNWAQETPNLPATAVANSALFAAPGANTAIEQTVDVSAASAAIDAGGTQFKLSAWLGGWRNRAERAVLTAVFLDATHHATGNPVVISDADANARANLTGLVARQQTGMVPANTRQIVVTVQFLGGLSSYHNAYADNLSLTLSGDLPNLSPTAALRTQANIPALDHVYVVMMENTNYADVVSTTAGSVSVNPQMPFLASLAGQGVLLTNMWGNYHPSDQNYVAMVAGDTYRYGSVYYPDYNLPVSHLGDLLEAHGKSWQAYVQNMKTPCNKVADANGQGYYAPDDQPFMNFRNVVSNPTRCVNTTRDLTDFAAAITANNLPNFAWLAADGWWDGEMAWWGNKDVGYSIAKQDEFLSSTIKPLLASPAWQHSRSLLIITWDESLGWGWPDNHVPTLLVASADLLNAGAVINQHYDGYSVLRTIERAFGLDGLGRFDQYAEPLNDVFKQNPATVQTTVLQPEKATVRGRLADTFGQVSTAAAIAQNQPLTLVASGGVTDASMLVNLAPLGVLPNADTTPSPIDPNSNSVTLQTQGLPPGYYGAWLRYGDEPLHQAATVFSILAKAAVTRDNPGVEIVGVAQNSRAEVREGANLIVHYCRPANAKPANTWIGIFPAGTPSNRMSKIKADAHGGFWLKTPGDQICAETMAFAAELPPSQDYQIVMLQNLNGTTSVVGAPASFTLTPALP